MRKHGKALTGKESSNPNGHTVCLDDFKVLSSVMCLSDLMIRESLLISKFEPSLNVQDSSLPITPYYPYITLVIHSMQIITYIL